MAIIKGASLNDFVDALTAITRAKENAGNLMKYVFPLYSEVCWFHGDRRRFAMVIGYASELRLFVRELRLLVCGAGFSDAEHYIDARKVIKVIRGNNDV